MTTGKQWEAPAPPPPDSPRKRHRIFLWIFLAVQVIFLIWVIFGIASGAGDPVECGTLTTAECNDASDVGTAIGVGILIAIWAAVDIILGFSYAIYRLGRRQ